MPNLASVFKAEISRVARKELRSETDPLKKLVASQRSAIASLRKQIQALERQVKNAGKTARVQESGHNEDDEGRAQVRFSAKGLAAHRQRLGISAADMGKLLGVSPLSVYKWESGKTRPRAKQLAHIAAVRRMGKREATSRLEALSA